MATASTSSARISRALNEIVIVFHDSKDVLRALQGFHDVIVGGQEALANDKLVSLLKAMCKDSDVDPAGVNDSFYLQPFNINTASAGKLGIDNDGTPGTQRVCARARHNRHLHERATRPSSPLIALEELRDGA